MKATTMTTLRLSSIKHAQKGVSMISVLLGLVIAAVVTITIYDQYTDAQRKTRVETATSEIASMIAESQKVYGAANQYAAVTTAVAVQGGVVPARLRIPGTNTAQNKYNGAVTFAPATVTTPNDSLTLGYSNVRREDCQDVVMSVQNLTRGIQVAAQPAKPNDGVVNVATLSTACDSAATVDVQFTFGRQ